MEVHVGIYALPERNLGNKFLRFRALFGTNFRAMVYKKIRKVRWHVVSIVSEVFVGKLHI